MDRAYGYFGVGTVGICFGIGITGLAVGAILRKVHQVYNTPQYDYFRDYNDMLQKLHHSQAKELVDVVIEGTVEKKHNSLDDRITWHDFRRGSTRHKMINGAIGGVILENTESSKQATILISVPFNLIDTNNNKVIVKDINLANGFYSLKDTNMPSIETEVGLMPNHILLSEKYSDWKSWMLEFGSSLAVIGKVTFHDGKKGGEMVFYPRKVGPSVESLIPKEEVLNLKKYYTPLIFGGIAFIAIGLAAASLLWIILSIRDRRRADIQNPLIG